MNERLAVISIIVEDRDSAARVNEILAAFGDCVLGRMGLPEKKRGVSVITIVADAPQELINAVTGKLGMVKNVSAKTMMR